jgi:hypothetical protein
MTGRVVPEVEAILARFPSYRLRTTALPSSGTRVTTSPQAELTKTSCFLGPTEPLLNLLWLGAPNSPNVAVRQTLRNLKTWLTREFPVPSCYSLIQCLGNLRPEVQIHSRAQRLAPGHGSTTGPESCVFPDKLADAREFFAAGTLKDIGDWFRRTGSATKRSAQIGVISWSV